MATEAAPARMRGLGRRRLVHARQPIRWRCTPTRLHQASAFATLGAVEDSAAVAKPLHIVIYSDDVNVRQQVILALGRRPHPDLPEVTYTEVATEPMVIRAMDAGDVDLAIFDGEAVPAGGMGIAKQLKDELYRCPPIVVLLGRPQDAWLATWSRAEAAVAHPIDPIALAEAVVGLLKSRVPARG